MLRRFDNLELSVKPGQPSCCRMYTGKVTSEYLSASVQEHALQQKRQGEGASLPSILMPLSKFARIGS